MTAHGPSPDRDGAQPSVDHLFAAVHGTAPDVVAAAPGRVNLIGEHTDYTGGLALPFALPHVTEVAAARRDDGLLALYSADRPGPLAYRRLAAPADGGAVARRGDWTDYPSGVALALREAGHPVGGASLAVRSTVPTGAGLSSSAALEVACALALTTLYGHRLDGPALAAVGRRAEQHHVGMPCGVMDQLAVACCRAGELLLIDTAALPSDPPAPSAAPAGGPGEGLAPLPFDAAAAGLRLLVIDTRVSHTLTDGGYGDRRAGCEAATAALGVGSLREVTPAGLAPALARLPEPLRPLVRHVVTENARVRRVAAALRAGTPRDVGPVLSAGHASLRDDFRVSCPELDTVVAAAENAGALGARMTGGGFGGSAIALVEAAAVPTVTRAVHTTAAAADQPTPRVFEAVPSAGARLLHGGA